MLDPNANIHPLHTFTALHHPLHSHVTYISTLSPPHTTSHTVYTPIEQIKAPLHINNDTVHTLVEQGDQGSLNKAYYTTDVSMPLVCGLINSIWSCSMLVLCWKHLKSPHNGELQWMSVVHGGIVWDTGNKSNMDCLYKAWGFSKQYRCVYRKCYNKNA